MIQTWTTPGSPFRVELPNGHSIDFSKLPSVKPDETIRSQPEILPEPILKEGFMDKETAKQQYRAAVQTAEDKALDDLYDAAKSADGEVSYSQAELDAKVASAVAEAQGVDAAAMQAAVDKHAAEMGKMHTDLDAMASKEGADQTTIANFRKSATAASDAFQAMLTALSPAINQEGAPPVQPVAPPVQETQEPPVVDQEGSDESASEKGGQTVDPSQDQQ